MKTDCLTDRDLILIHYGETPDGASPAAAAAHLTACASCRARLGRLAADLARIPASTDPGPAAATRIAARVSERLSRRRPWRPLAGALAAGTLALAVTLTVWLPGSQPPPAGQPPAVARVEAPFVGPPLPTVRQASLDVDLLEQLDLLEELETLRAIEGV